MKFQTEITTAAARFGLDYLLVGGIVQVESNFTPWAWNPEPAYRYFWDVRNHKPFRAVTPAELIAEQPPLDFSSIAGDPDQEWWGQQSSWGLMQIMGAAAREQGFLGSYLPELCDPTTNLIYGCKFFAQLLAWAKGDVEQACAAWNGGRLKNSRRPFQNQAYATKVISARSSLKLGAEK